MSERSTEQTQDTEAAASARRPQLPPGLYWRGPTIWLKVYLPDGRIIRESCKTDRVAVARRLLDQRKGVRATGLPILPRTERVTLGELFDDLVTEYRTNQRRSLDRLGNSLTRLRPVFAMRRAQSVTAAEVRDYVDARLQAGAAHATINRELAALKRAYTLGITGQRIIKRPPITLLAEDNVRQGFLEREEYKAVRAYLPAHLLALVESCTSPAGGPSPRCSR